MRMPGESDLSSLWEAVETEPELLEGVKTGFLERNMSVFVFYQELKLALHYSNHATKVVCLSSCRQI